MARRGHDVVVVDDLIYTRHPENHPLPPGCTFIKGDFRDEDLLHSVLPGADAVVHLGGLVGEPACAVDEAFSVEVNFAGPVLAGEVAATYDIPRYVFLSTCSVYGRQDGLVTEETPANPLSTYAWTKLEAERRLTEVLHGHTRLAVLRLATVFGLSPRMRLDSVVNSMAARAAATGSLPLRGGSQWRPLVYVRDVAACIRRLVEDEVRIEPDCPLILNVGNDAHNHTIAEIARTVVSRLPAATISTEEAATDHRDYRVSFQRIDAVLPGSCGTPIQTGIDEITAAVRSGRFAAPTSMEYDNLRGLRAALEEKRTRVLGTAIMDRLGKDYTPGRAPAESPPAGRPGQPGYDEVAAASYWGGPRLAGIRTGDRRAEDAAVLCQGKPPAISWAYAAWEADCIDSLLPDLADRTVVDLGCGVGRLLPDLARRAKRVTGVDVAPGMVARARSRLTGVQNAEVLVGSVADVPVPSESVDVVLCLGVFEHISEAHRVRALTEIARLLRPGGLALLELNNADSVLLGAAVDDNPHRLGVQLDNGYFCELVRTESVLAAAELAGLVATDRAANPFFSAARHAADTGDPEGLVDLLSQARALDRALGGSPALSRLADQHMIRLVKQ
ncbi:NAD-dependent epimerase/dehydratase family protein [Micromonospora tulbaghiae]|uniref:NAD-dependent epimerase/dehydratase family protein n=1 Tax=Micromonospora tulbaghiae TaxID=479978 RepID=UPI003665328B